MHGNTKFFWLHWIYSHVSDDKELSAYVFFLYKAFGVGAFEEEDEDIYSMDSMQNYDSVLGDEVDPDSTYGWTKPKAITGYWGVHRSDLRFSALKWKYKWKNG